jgi:EAL domain-containing protein (putative c-di-GMP-specific phosphodiesterase class I)
MTEETGLIVPLGQWVLPRHAGRPPTWQREHPDTRPVISVNLAVRQVRDPAIVDEVRAILDETGLPAAMLQLELTESAVMGTGGSRWKPCTRWLTWASGIAIDDFGTGYSNLAYLRTCRYTG